MHSLNNNLFFLKNNYVSLTREYTVVNNSLIPIYYKTTDNQNTESLYYSIEIRDNLNVVLLSLDKNANILKELKIIGYDKAFTHYYNFDVDQYLKHSSALAIGISKSYFDSETKSLYLPLKFQIHLFKNLIIILLEHNFCPQYYINEHDLFGALTDKDFNIIGFVINKIPAITISHIKHNFEHRNLLEESPFPLYDCETKIMNNTNYLIQKIIELENIDQWHILYYGLKKDLIDPQFILNYCYALIEQGQSSDQFVLDIAALTDTDEIDRIHDIIALKINNREAILVDNGQYYNKVWFYLSLATDMCAQRIIR